MDHFFEFVITHWILSSLWIVVFILVMLNENRRGGAQLSPQQVTHLINNENGVVIDVRKKEDFKTGHLPNSINIPAASISNRMGELDPYKNKPVILVCRSGQTAGATGAELAKAGFTQVSRLRGGILEWENSNLPLVKKS